jgi:hypothetical protein
MIVSTETVQLLFVGDESSGKSSVLQAITKLPFPVHEEMCTYFPTEMSLQRSAGPESISVQIRITTVRNVTSDANSVDQNSDGVEVSESVRL